jgi:deoxyribodipyrimidine photo-lyase
MVLFLQYLFIIELIVRRELAYNFVYYNPTYDEFKYMTYDWAYMTMEKHLKDEREYLYTKEDYLSFKTHDPYFNAAMKEMVYLGKMHSYMRMYWCKKIIEWSKTYEEAFKTAIELNNYYFTDGLTPNGYCGVAWCFGKHDRAWTERDIFGKLRYMNANGLKRKFAIDDYVEKMNKIEKENR